MQNIMIVTAGEGNTKAQQKKDNMRAIIHSTSIPSYISLF